MGDSKTNEDMTGQDERTTVWPNSTETIISSDLSVSHENQTKTMERDAVDWPVENQPMMNNSSGEKSENNYTSFSSDGRASGRSGPGPSPAFLASLTSLGEHPDHMLLPHSLHQTAETYFHEEDYQWAVEFLCLEMLYHERLLSNLGSMQKDWESRWKSISQTKTTSPVKLLYTETETKRMDSLYHICRTHHRPNHTAEKISKETSRGNPLKIKEWTEHPDSDSEEEKRHEEEDKEDNVEDECMREEVQISGDDLTDYIKVEETCPSNGLISILKKRTCPEESSAIGPSPSRSSSKLKVRFSETEALQDNDEVGEASCLFFLILCLVTVLISMTGTMLYCFLGGAYSKICTDFSHNMDFFFGFVRQAADTLTHFFITASSSSSSSQPC